MNFQSKSLASIILIIIALILGYFVVMPRWTSYSEARTQLAAEKDTQEQLKKAQSDITAFLAEYNQHTSEAALINGVLPLSETQIQNVLKSLEDLTKGSGISLGQLTVENRPDTDISAAQPNAIQPMDLSLSVTGEYPAFKDFLVRLENTLRIVDVKSVTISTDQESNKNKYDLKFRTYYQK